jgi:putative transposase
MPNHVHFVAVPGNENSLACTFKMAHSRYAQYLNWKRDVKGHLWQGRFYSSILDGAHFLAAARYVERNPMRAGLVGAADMWEWSSARCHLGQEENKYGFDLDAMWSFIPDSKMEWREHLSMRYETDSDDLIRANTRTGRPICDAAYMRMLENRLGRRLHAMPIGRPNCLEETLPR